MSDPIMVDAAAKGPPPKPESKAEPGDKPAGARSAGPFPPAPVPRPAGGGVASRLGKLGLTKRQAAVAASAVFSLAAGVAGVRLIWPSGGPQDPPAAEPVVAQQAAAPAKVLVPVHPEAKAEPRQEQPARPDARPPQPGQPPPPAPAPDGWFLRDGQTPGRGAGTGPVAPSGGPGDPPTLPAPASVAGPGANTPPAAPSQPLFAIPDPYAGGTTGGGPRQPVGAAGPGLAEPGPLAPPANLNPQVPAAPPAGPTRGPSVTVEVGPSATPSGTAASGGTRPGSPAEPDMFGPARSASNPAHSGAPGNVVPAVEPGSLAPSPGVTPAGGLLPSPAPAGGAQPPTAPAAPGPVVPSLPDSSPVVPAVPPTAPGAGPAVPAPPANLTPQPAGPAPAPKSPSAPAGLPDIPTTPNLQSPGLAVPAAPAAPGALPASPTQPGGTPPPPVQGRPVTPPTTGGNPGVIAPPAGPDTGPARPQPPDPTRTPGAPANELNFNKPPNTPNPIPVGPAARPEAPPTGVRPAGGSDRPPQTSFDVDLYEPRGGDTYQSVAREFYNDDRYAAALREYNRGRPVQPGQSVEVPPIGVLRKRYPAMIGPTSAPAGRSGSAPPPAGDWAPAGGPRPEATPAFRSAGGSSTTFRVPAGGGMTLKAVARQALGSDQRWDELYQLNPQVNPSEVLPPGTELKLPAGARSQ